MRALALLTPTAVLLSSSSSLFSGVLPISVGPLRDRFAANRKSGAAITRVALRALSGYWRANQHCLDGPL